MNYTTNPIIVLYIDDNESEQEKFLYILKNAEVKVSAIHIATNIDEANQFLNKISPDIIFSSILPHEHINETFINKLKELTISIPLVTLSDDANDSFSNRALSLGAHDHLFRNEISGPILKKTIQFCFERIKNNIALREAIDRYHLIAKATNDIAWDWELNKRSAYWTGNGIKSILKLPQTEINVGSDFWETHIHPEDKDRVINKLNHIFKEAVIDNWEDEYRFRNKEGVYKNIYDRGFIIYKNNIPVRMVGIMADITSKILLKKKVEAENIFQQKRISEAVIAAQEKEKSEIGKELHDNVNQLLSASRLYIDAAKKDKEKSSTLLNQASSYIKTAIEEIRTLSKVLHTPLITDLGLKDSIKNLAEEMMAVSDLKINIIVNHFDEQLLNDNFKLTLYRIIQEQITNILKHAKAHTACITIDNSENFILLEVVDDGIGFDIKKKSTGIGISNIVSRARMYNGSMSLDSMPQEGSILKICFPSNEITVLKMNV